MRERRCHVVRCGSLARRPETNLTVRNCNIRGFQHGVLTEASNGHVVEDNRFEGNTLYAVRLSGSGANVRHNQVLDTGGATGVANTIAGIVVAEGDVLDNTIRGVFGDPALPGYAIAIFHQGLSSGVVAGNRIGEVVRSPTGSELDIYIGGPTAIIRDNSISRLHATAVAVICVDGTSTAQGNVTNGPGNLLSGCHDAGGNTSPP